MSDEKDETIADIISEMRGLHDAGKWLEQPDSWSQDNCIEALKHYSDRIESAYRRMVLQQTEMLKAFGVS